MAYRPSPVSNVSIPKISESKKGRNLGISTFEDKLIQKMMQKVLSSVYEPIFKKCSYGFRQGVGPHLALKALSRYLYRSKTRVIINVDIAKFFDRIDHVLLRRMIERKIHDKKLVRYIVRMFKAVVLNKDELVFSQEGIPQGSVCTPILANIFAYYSIGSWFEGVVEILF